MRVYKEILMTQVNLVVQYRAQAIAGAFTQSAFGLIRAYMIVALYSASTSVPMALEQAVSYVWITQILLTMIAWGPDPIVSTMIREGSVAYELVRPLRLSIAWLMRSMAFRGMMPLMRALPIIFFGMILPKQYGLHINWPALNALQTSAQLALVVIGLIFAWLLASALNNTTNILTLWLMDDSGIVRLIPIVMMFFSGLILPMPLFPDFLQPVLQWSPFMGIMDTPSRLITFHLNGTGALFAITIQLIWIIVINLLNDFLLEMRMKKCVLHGG